MEFLKYNSIENTYQTKTLEFIRIYGFDMQDWIVQEKVHGANFSFHTDGEVVQMAKRSGFIAADEDFYNANQVLAKYKLKVLSLFEQLQENKNIQQLSIYGELYGGSYNHKEVERDPNATQVQKGIFYNPKNDFYAFDIKCDGELMNVTEANSWFERLNFFYAKPLFQGSFEEALKYPNQFQTKIPMGLGLPEVDDNLCEGVVLKPIEPKFFNNGKRVILKNKNAKWSEKSSVKKVKQPEVFSNELQGVWENMEQFVTKNRWQNVLSKEGEFEIQKMGKYIGLFSKDVIEDFLKEYKENWISISKSDQKKITKKLNQTVSKLIKEEIMK